MLDDLTAANIGFLTVLHEAGGHVGGYLVTNIWGRPLEFRLSTAVQPNRVQQVLYGQTLESYLCADLIGKTLVEKTPSQVQLVVTDCEPALELRKRVEMPVAWLAPSEATISSDPKGERSKAEVLSAAKGGPLFRHQRFPEDSPVIRRILDNLDGNVSLAEPFLRIREAIGEARKMGVMRN